jgi:hypothetical protein
MSRREISGGRLVRQAKIIKVPMLVVSGEEDQIVGPHSVSAWAGSVQRAEICLMDACGHTPMVERPAEFAAQILAFLTGDARYLDQAAPPPAADDEEDFPDAGHAPAYANDQDDLRPADPYGDAYADAADDTADDTSDLTVEYSIEDVAPEPSDPPKIHRKRDGGYPAEARDGQSPAPKPPESTFRGRKRRATPAHDPIPELPADLFNWPEPRRGPRRPAEGPEGDDTTGSSNGPSHA